jgi:OPA family glycerol-3-phosphate transporter-like MFS transporter
MVLSIAMQGMLRDGISTWLPTFLTETFHLESVVSILVGVALPIMHVLVNLVVYKLLIAMKKDIFGAIGVLFLLISLLLFSMHLFGSTSALVSMLLIAVANGAINGVNTLQTCYIPAMYRSSQNMSFIVGLLNGATYIGSAVSIYLFAVISEIFGWSATVIGWVITAAAGLALTLCCREVLKRKNQHILH